MVFWQASRLERTFCGVVVAASLAAAPAFAQQVISGTSASNPLTNASGSPFGTTVISSGGAVVGGSATTVIGGQAAPALPQTPPTVQPTAVQPATVVQSPPVAAPPSSEPSVSVTSSQVPSRASTPSLARDEDPTDLFAETGNAEIDDGDIFGSSRANRNPVFQPSFGEIRASGRPGAVREAVEAALDGDTDQDGLLSADEIDALPLEEGENAPILLRADEVSRDQDLGVVVARGNVEVDNGIRVILSDTLSYNQNGQTVSASGNVRLLEPDGTVIFADFMELTDDLLDGTVENLRILMDNNARVAANGGRRVNGNRTEMASAVYSACDACEEDPNRAPLWQLKATRVVHDQEGQTVEYTNAFLELFGLPVLYTPYLSHPDPTVRRRSGFLVPSWGTTENTGSFVQVPYFWAVDDQQDFLFDPIRTSDQGLIFSGEYRRAFDNGAIRVSGSGMEDDFGKRDSNGRTIKLEDEFRGHIFADGRYDLDETWTAGFEVERVTDRSYFKRYTFWGDPGNTAESRAYLTGYRGRNYMALEGLSFQDLRSNRTEDTPEIFPIATYRGIGEPDNWGGRWSLDARARVISDNDSASTRLISLDTGYQREVISDFGVVNNFGLNMRSDLYHIDTLAENDPNGVGEDDIFTGRLHPTLSYQASYPLVRYSVHGRQVIEPVAAAFVSPNGGNPSDIVNIDSLIFETDYVSLFDSNRVHGLDRIESGNRVAGGINLRHYGDGGGRYAAFLGNTYRFREDRQLVQDLGIREGQSDYVGVLEANPTKYINLAYRFNMASDTFATTRNEIETSIGGRGLRLTGNYLFVADEVTNGREVESLRLGGTSQINEFWSVRAGTNRDLRDEGRSLRHFAGLSYEDECFIVNGSYTRTFFRGEDIEPTDSLQVRVSLITLGDFQF